MYVYKQTQLDPDLWTVGFYDPSGKWEPESDHESSEAAAEQVRYLNGANSYRDKWGSPLPEGYRTKTLIEQLATAIWNALPYDQEHGPVCPELGEAIRALRQGLQKTGLTVIPADVQATSDVG